MRLRLFVAAGEASGDMHAAHLLEALRRHHPDLEVAGIGGNRMAAAGVRLLAHEKDLAVVGITEVASRLGALLRALRSAGRYLAQHRPHGVILVDFPDFNLRIARKARRLGIPVVYYIGPQVWAWRRRRVHTLSRLVRRMVVILPFEAALYRDAGADCVFVGHPLVDLVRPRLNREAGMARYALREGRPIVALLPGSRWQEVRRLLPEMLRAVARLAREGLPVQAVIPVAPSLDPAWVQRQVAASGVEARVVHGEAVDVLQLCDCAVVASGTVTLEAAFLEKPMVIVYRVSRLTYWAARFLVGVQHIGLVNIVAGREVVPELLQDAVTPEGIALQVRRLLDPRVRQRVVASLQEVRRALVEPGAADRAARAVLQALKPEPSGYVARGVEVA